MELTIPRLNVRADIEHLGLTPQGAIGAPAGPQNVSWFTQSPRPGEPGNAILSGHTGRWRDGRYSVFDLLNTARVGDIVEIKDSNGATARFRVTGTQIYGKDAVVPELFEKSDKATVSIITCHGTWLADQRTYSHRFIVHAEKIINE
jgi:LPXTG-site transpeptidase (sortase) family protein